MAHKAQATVRWNSEWLSQLGFDDVIRIVSMYNVGRMLERRDFKERFESGARRERLAPSAAASRPER
jgi:tyrosyl-tRNA synthetase